MQVTQFCHRYRAVAAGVLVSLWCVNGAAQSDSNAWVTDELSTYVRSGPTDGYRIVGTLSAGEQVEVLETNGDYSRVRGDDDEAVWILSEELQQTPSASEQLPELESQVESLTEELDGINEEWEQRVASMRETLDAREQRIDELETRNDQLGSDADESSEKVRSLEARLDTQEEDLLLRYFMYGGGVAGAGLVVGLIVPHLPRRRKKRDRWF